MRTNGYMPLFKRAPSLILDLDCLAFLGLPNEADILSWASNVGGIVLTGHLHWYSSRSAVHNGSMNVVVFYTLPVFTIEFSYFFQQNIAPWMMGFIVLQGDTPRPALQIGYSPPYLTKCAKKDTFLCVSNASSGGDQWNTVRVTHNDSDTPKTKFYNNGVLATLSNDNISLSVVGGKFWVSCHSLIYLTSVKMWDGVVIP